MTKLDLPAPYRIVEPPELHTALKIAFGMVGATTRNDYASNQADRSKAAARRDLAADVLATMVVDHLRQGGRQVVTTAPAPFVIPCVNSAIGGTDGSIPDAFRRK